MWGRLSVGSELGKKEFRFKTKSPGVDVYEVQDLYSWGRLILVSELGMNEYRFGTKSLGVDLY